MRSWLPSRRLRPFRSVGRIEAETRRVRNLVEATSAEAKSVRGEVESHIAELAAASQASASQLAEQVATQVTKVAEYTDAQALRVAADVTARLGKEVQAAASSATATAKITMRTVVEGARRDIQAQIDANRADTLRQTEETKAQVQNISAQLAKLTEQLNQFRPASEKNVGEGYENMSASFQEKFNTQQYRKFITCLLWYWKLRKACRKMRKLCTVYLQEWRTWGIL